MSLFLSLCFRLTIKKVLVSPLYEKGNAEPHTNSCPITATGALAKNFEQVIRNQINDYLFPNINNLDIGNKCQKQMLYYNVRNVSRTEMDKKNTVCGAFFDLSKIFDSISHKIQKN